MMIHAPPLATYRIQLTADFGFDEATRIAPYLKQLGITHFYASPFLKARHGSTHGYDIVDHNVINPELGGEEGFERLSKILRDNDIGLILDFVPNHMGVHFADNAWWLDVLEWGKASPYATAFDIDWETLPYRSKGGLLLPILGSSYGETLDKGDIELRFDADEGSFSAWYFEHRLPIAPQRYSEILRTVVNETHSATTLAGAKLLEIAGRYTGLHRPNRAQAPALRAALASDPAFSPLIDEGLKAYRSGPEPHACTQALHSLLERQHYKVAHWRLATSEINYRRFFDVNNLAGLRVEEQQTFDNIHRLVRRLIAEDKLQGLRLDHIDGLRDPAQYCQRLARLVREAKAPGNESFYVVIEKILGEHEALPLFSGIQGTTGYEWLNVLTQTLLDGRGLGELDETWRQASNVAPNLEPVLLQSKQRVLETLLASEFTVLCRLLARIAAGHYSTRDFSADSLRQAFELYVLHFPIYRTYLTASGPSKTDRDIISRTIERARADWFNADEGIFDFLRDVLTLDLIKQRSQAPGKPRIRRFAFKVQQFTGPMMAKSLEDTAFYRFHRLIALNEVGGNPSARALATDDFHGAMRNRLSSSPHGMTATATHDTKRGEDSRMRILALSEFAEEWTLLVGQWKEFNARFVTSHGGIRSPSIAFEYMLYQSLIGAWPEQLDQSFIDRLIAYAIKAAREAKLETSWLNPNAAYEEGLKTFIAAILNHSSSPDFLDSLASFAQRTALMGALNSLSQITLKAMMPGVPDFYQGTEFWDYSFVDPDNRRPVDFSARESALRSIEQPDWPNLVQNWQDGRIKLAWTKTLLALRKERPSLFTHGDYRPIRVEGRDSNHVIAFARRHRQEAVIVAIGRHFAGMTERGKSWPTGTIEAALDLTGYEVTSRCSHETEVDMLKLPLFVHFPAAVLRADVSPRVKGQSTIRL